MPSGVEHTIDCIARGWQVIVRPPSMPSGVEHLVCCGGFVLTPIVRPPSMPSGVEHYKSDGTTLVVTRCATPFDALGR